MHPGRTGMNNDRKIAQHYIFHMNIFKDARKNVRGNGIVPILIFVFINMYLTKTCSNYLKV